MANERERERERDIKAYDWKELCENNIFPLKNLKCHFKH